MYLMNNAESKTHFCPILVQFNSASARFTLYVFITVSQNLKKHSNKLYCFWGKQLKMIIFSYLHNPFDTFCFLLLPLPATLMNP